MPDFAAMTSDELYDRLAQLETAIAAGEPSAGQPIGTVFRHLFDQLRQVALIHVQLAKRTATGWKPL